MQSLADLDGARVATSFPRLARALLPDTIELVDVHGSVELAPRLGLADAIVDLVSSGSTLRTNGLRSLARLLDSEAVLIGPPEPSVEALELAAVFRSVVQARGARYLMLNAPESALEEIARLVPGSRAPSVLPLAEPGMVAVHSVVPAADVFKLLPKLEAAGATSILLVPLERMLAMRPLPGKLPAVRLGALHRRARAARGPRPGRDRALRRQRPAATAPELAAGRDRGCARCGEHVSARRLSADPRGDRRVRGRRARERRARRGRGRPHSALRAHVRRAG